VANRWEVTMMRIPISPFALCVALAVLAYLFLVATGSA
jgi:hypothetical protein